MKNQRIKVIRDEVWQTAKSMFGIIIAVGGGIVPFVIYMLGLLKVTSFLWIITAFFFVFCLILIWNLSKYAQEGYWFDRKYKLLKVKWSYLPNEDLETLQAMHEGERQLVCLSGTLPYMTIAVSPAENLTPFSPEDKIDVRLHSFKRSGGTVSVRQPHRQSGSNFSFRVDFNPPLCKGEEVFFKYSFTFPKFKTSTLESLRSRCQSGKLDARDYEYVAWNISFPFERFIYEHYFSPKCKIKPLGIEVYKGAENLFQFEKKQLLKHHFFECTEIDGGWLMKIDRKNPPMKTKYLIKWRPPLKRELSDLFGKHIEH